MTYTSSLHFRPLGLGSHYDVNCLCPGLLLRTYSFHGFRGIFQCHQSAFFFETHCPVLDSHLCSSLPAKGIYQLWYIDSIRLAILYSYNRKLGQSLSFARSWTTQTRVKNVWIIMTYITSTTLNPVRTV